MKAPTAVNPTEQCEDLYFSESDVEREHREMLLKLANATENHYADCNVNGNTETCVRDFAPHSLEFNAACLDAGGKLWKFNMDGSCVVSGIGFTFYLYVTYSGLPLCSSASCSDKDSIQSIATADAEATESYFEDYHNLALTGACAFTAEDIQEDVMPLPTSGPISDPTSSPAAAL